MIKRTVGYPLAILGAGCLVCGTIARADAPPVLTQRKINGMAAKIEQALSEILEAPKLRRPNEALHAYCLRLTALLPNEVTNKQKKRLMKYVDSLAQAVPSGMTSGTMPALSDASGINQTRWQQLTRTLAYLPARLRKLRAAITGNLSAASEMEQTLALLASARNVLRDARP